jgi:hypothetical protein
VHFVPSQPVGDGLLTGLPEVAGVEHHNRRVQENGAGDLASAVIQTLTAAGVTAHDLELTSGTLEDAFIKLTGGRLASSPHPPRSPRERRRPAARERRPLLPGSVTRHRDSRRCGHDAPAMRHPGNMNTAVRNEAPQGCRRRGRPRLRP